MLAYQADSSAEGTKSARMEQRTTAEAKELIERAAHLLGVNPSEFTVSAATRAARQTLKDYEMTVLQPSAHAAFLQAMDATEPTADLVDLMKMHSQMTKTK
jgi:uncharacterized protein (DUF1778 family)